MSNVVQEEHPAAGDSVVEQAQEKVKETAQQTKGVVARTVSDRVEATSAQAATQLNDISRAFRRTSQELRGEGKDQPAQVVDVVSDRTEQLARYLSESTSSRILDDLERLGRSRPWVAIAGGLAVGVFAGRLLKASSRQRFENYRSQYPQGYPQRLSPSVGATEQMPVVPTTPVQHGIGA
jgi:ElaB/YqjD/DUF883 family membrane-anchored ribosome-binding protein